LVEGGSAARKLCLELEELPLALSHERLATLKLTNLQVQKRKRKKTHTEIRGE
jgi:hypothetical protein